MPHHLSRPEPARLLSSWSTCRRHLLSPTPAAPGLRPPGSRAAAPATLNPFSLEVIVQVAIRSKHQPRCQSAHRAQDTSSSRIMLALMKKPIPPCGFAHRGPNLRTRAGPRQGDGGEESAYPPGCALGQGNSSQPCARHIQHSFSELRTHTRLVGYGAGRGPGTPLHGSHHAVCKTPWRSGSCVFALTSPSPTTMLVCFF